MKWFIRNTKQSSVGNTKAKTVSCNRCTFHIQGDRARLTKSTNWPRIIPQFPIPIVNCGDSSSTHYFLKIVALQFSNLRHRRLESNLHFGKGRYGNPDRKVVVQNFVFSDIRMSEDKIAQILTVPQSSAVPNHQPSMRAQDGNVISCGLSIGRPNADIY